MNKRFEQIENFNNKLKLIGVLFGGISAVLMMLLIGADVFMRNILISPIPGTYEIVQFYLMPLAIFPALAYTYSSGILPKIDDLIVKFSNSIQTIMKFIIFLIEIIIFSLLTIYGWKLAMSGVSDQMAVTVGSILMPIYPVYFVVPIGFGLIVLEVFISGIKPILQQKV
ncbi:TRAP transporter small permease [Bacillus sp. B15-48]|uniref:TRAP transporter small permease n=1 Tax=Bacillus sp. B15-48 TaxID=1548601 RepID=UPI00193FDF1A|nr:TRAP transporter small permease [Bacillus sp. B15-48]